MTKRIIYAALAVMIFIIGCDTMSNNPLSSSINQEAIYTPPDVTGKYIVTVSGAPSSALGKVTAGASIISVLARFNIDEEVVDYKYTHALVGFSAALDDSQVEQLISAGYRVEPDQIITIFQGKGGGKPGSGDDNTDPEPQVTPWGITRVGGSIDGSGKTAWIIDTGIDLDHPDLNVDVSRSATFILKGPDSKSANDGNGHGTHVAGTVAAIDNQIDVVGVAAGATVVAVKVLDRRGSGTISGVIAGIEYVAEFAVNGEGANLSLGGGFSEALNLAVSTAASKGIFFAIAAGNSGADANNYSPASTEADFVWTISAHDINNVMPSFSNWSGPTNPPIEFAAPGVSILSLWKDGGTKTISGTSMSAPHALGVLLNTNGNPNSDGLVSNDKDDDPDPIMHN